jgi:hypothetical protein
MLKISPSSMPSDSMHVLVGVGVDGLFERLAQQVLAALGVGDQPVDGQHQVVGHQRVGGGEEAQAALDDQAFVARQAVFRLPQRDVGVHVHFLGHPVVGAAVQVFLPGPVVLERHELVQVGAAVDHALLIHRDALVLVGAAVAHHGRVQMGEGGFRLLHDVGLGGRRRHAGSATVIGSFSSSATTAGAGSGTGGGGGSMAAGASGARGAGRAAGAAALGLSSSS